MCCFSPSICAACACASTIQAPRCSCRRRCSAMARPACCCAIHGARVTAPVGHANGAGPRILAAGEWCWRGTEHIMGWDIKDDGFGIVLSSGPAGADERGAQARGAGFPRPQRLSSVRPRRISVPSRRPAAARDGGAGARSLRPRSLNIPGRCCATIGNMSSATVLFVLDRAMKAGARGRHLLAAFGPGFSAYFVVADL